MHDRYQTAGIQHSGEERDLHKMDTYIIEILIHRLNKNNLVLKLFARIMYFPKIIDLFEGRKCFI